MLTIDDVLHLTYDAGDDFILYDICGSMGKCPVCRRTSGVCGNRYPAARIKGIECYGADFKNGSWIPLTQDVYDRLKNELLVKYGLEP